MTFTESLIQFDTVLAGVSYEISTAENDGIIWNNRDYKFSNLPSYLVGTLLFEVPHKISKDKVIDISVPNTSIIYLVHEEGSRSGGFENSLTNSLEWALEDDNAEIGAGSTTFKYVWKNYVLANGRTTIILPATTTNEAVLSIFVRGISFKITID